MYCYNRCMFAWCVNKKKKPDMFCFVQVQSRMFRTRTWGCNRGNTLFPLPFCNPRENACRSHSVSIILVIFNIPVRLNSVTPFGTLCPRTEHEKPGQTCSGLILQVQCCAIQCLKHCFPLTRRQCVYDIMCIPNRSTPQHQYIAAQTLSSSMAITSIEHAE